MYYKMKPQKPIDRRPKCKTCRERFVPINNNFNQKNCLVNDQCILAHSNMAKAAKEKSDKKNTQEKKDQIKTHSVWSSELDELVQEIARLIDKDLPCISCLKPPKKKNGGHRFSKAAEKQLRHNMLNIHLQCESCNGYNHGNADGYDHGLSCMYGNEYLEEVHALKIIYPTNKKSIPELINAKVKARRIIKGLKSLDLCYPVNVRIELRKKYNDLIGLYK